mmetsp:Transcript_649/g.1075  ORF Transcript_649/g.1075 Transcript_649/m.1075 type:complete len:518 (+) Transcript_649:67-1620(+)
MMIARRRTSSFVTTCAVGMLMLSQAWLNAKQDVEDRVAKVKVLFGDENLVGVDYNTNDASKNTTNKSDTSNKRNDLPQHPRLRRFTADDMNNFPKPEFGGCNKHRLCTFENVCFSNQDGMLIFQTPELLQDENEWYTTSGKDGVGRVTIPRRPVLQSNYTELTNVYFTERMFVLNCWRQSSRAMNPAHMMMGTGKLFVAATGYYETGKTNNGSNLSLDVVLHHHCANPSEINWAWGEMIESLVSKEVVSAGILVPPLKTENQSSSIYVPYSPGSTLKQDDFVICGKTVYQAPFSTALYLGPNDDGVVAKWQASVSDHIKEQNWTVATKETSDLKGSNATPSCRRNLQIAVWRRTEGTALRLLTNLDEVERLVAKYTDQPVSIVTVSSKTSPEEQAAVFRSFDILITPHGSHLTNMIFSPRNATVYIEVAAVYFDRSPEINGRAFAKDWISSFGHLPFSKDPELLESMEACSASTSIDPLNGCPRSLRKKFIQSDLVVNTTILGANLEKAVSAFCPEE